MFDILCLLFKISILAGPNVETGIFVTQEMNSVFHYDIHEKPSRLWLSVLCIYLERRAGFYCYSFLV